MNKIQINILSLFVILTTFTYLFFLLANYKPIIAQCAQDCQGHFDPTGSQCPEDLFKCVRENISGYCGIIGGGCNCLVPINCAPICAISSCGDIDYVQVPAPASCCGVTPSPPPSPTPTTAPGGSGGCGSCSSCGHPTSECVLWEGNCVWDPARCAPSGGGSAPQWCLLGRVESGTFDISTAYFRRGILPDCSRIKVNNCYLQVNPPEADFKVLWTVNDTNVVRIRNAPWGGPIINPSTSGPYYYMYFRPVSAGQTRIYARGLVNGVERCHSSALITITDSSETPLPTPSPTPSPTPPPSPSCSISLNPSSLTRNIGQSATLNASISVRNGSVSFVSFSSSNSSIANVVSPDFSFPFNTELPPFPQEL